MGTFGNHDCLGTAQRLLATFTSRSSLLARHFPGSRHSEVVALTRFPYGLGLGRIYCDVFPLVARQPSNRKSIS